MKFFSFATRVASAWVVAASVVAALAVNAQTAPTITTIADQTINESANTGALAFTVGDAETAPAALVMSAASSNTTLVPVANIVFGGSAASRTVTVTPVSPLSGTATITLTVTDGSNQTASTSFVLTVNPVNGVPTFTLAGNQTITYTGSNVVTVPNFATAIDDGDPDFTQTLSFNVSNTNSALFTPTGQPSIDPAGTLTYTPSGESGAATLQVTLTDDATAGGPALTSTARVSGITVNNAAPAVVYAPNPAANAVPLRTVYLFNGAPLPGVTRSSPIPVTPQGSPTGNSATETTTVNSCSLSGPDAASFGSVAGVNLTFNAANPAAQNIPVSCTSGATNRSASLSCTETRGVAPSTNRTWPLNCPSCYLSFSSTLDSTPPVVDPALGVPSATGIQTGRLNRFGADSICGVSKSNPLNNTTVGARQFDRYTITPTIAGCVAVRVRWGANNNLFMMVASPFVPANPATNWVADVGSSSQNEAALSFTATAGQSYDVVVHEVNVGGGIGQAYTLEVDTCNVPPVTAEVSINDVSIAEGNSGTTNATFTVTRTNATTAFTVPYATVDGTATAGSDFAATSGTLTFAAGGPLTQTITVPINGDTTFEPDENFIVRLGAITNTSGFTTVSKADGAGTILNDDTRQADLAITKTDGVTTVTAGGSVIYTITASNAGPNDATGATVTDTFPAALLNVSWTCVGAGGGTCTASGSGNINDTVNLPVGASVTYTASASVSAAATGSLSNTATVATPANVTELVPGNNSATDTDTITRNADVSITVTDGVASVSPGSAVTYTITASNAGPSNAPGSTVSDTFPASLSSITWTCVGAGGGTCTASGSGNISDTVNLPAGASVTYTVSATLSNTAIGSLSNTASVATAAGVTDPATGNNSATDTDTIQPTANLAVALTNNATTVTRGSTTTYVVTATNAGPVAANGANVSVPLPSAFSAATWTCVGASGGTCAASGTGNVAESVNLPSGASVTYTINATVSNSAAGSVSVTATIAVPAAVADPNTANNSATDTDTVTVPSIVVTGASSGAGGSVSCASPVDFGNTTTCAVLAQPGYRINTVSGCGGTPSATSTYVTGPIIAACTVTALFDLEIAPAVPVMNAAAIAALLAAMFAVAGFALRRRTTR